MAELRKAGGRKRARAGLKGLEWEEKEKRKVQSVSGIRIVRFSQQTRLLFLRAAYLFHRRELDRMARAEMKMLADRETDFA